MMMEVSCSEVSILRGTLWGQVSSRTPGLCDLPKQIHEDSHTRKLSLLLEEIPAMSYFHLDCPSMPTSWIQVCCHCAHETHKR